MVPCVRAKRPSRVNAEPVRVHDDPDASERFVIPEETAHLVDPVCVPECKAVGSVAAHLHNHNDDALSGRHV